MQDQLDIGFIGVGIMGAPMSRRLAQAGFRVTAWNRTRANVEALGAAGVAPAATPAAAAAGRDFVICMLSDGPVCDAVLFDHGAVAAMRPGAILLVMASIPVATARAQAARAAHNQLGYLDAPVSGGERGAIEGTLAIMAGGDPALFARAVPVLQILGRPTRVGPVGTGQLTKLANQIIVGNTLATVAEALLLAQAGGADPAAVRQALMGGFADSPILQQHAQRMIAGDWEPGGPAKHQLKDLRTATALAAELHLTLPVSQLVQGLFEELVAQGHGERDHSAVYLELARGQKLP